MLSAEIIKKQRTCHAEADKNLLVIVWYLRLKKYIYIFSMLYIISIIIEYASVMLSKCSKLSSHLLTVRERERKVLFLP